MAKGNGVHVWRGGETLHCRLITRCIVLYVMMQQQQINHNFLAVLTARTRPNRTNRANYSWTWQREKRAIISCVYLDSFNCTTYVRKTENCPESKTTCLAAFSTAANEREESVFALKFSSRSWCIWWHKCKICYSMSRIKVTTTRV